MWQTKVNLVDLCCIVWFWKLKSSSLNELLNGEDFLWFKGPSVTFQKPVHHAQCTGRPEERGVQNILEDLV